MRKVPAALLFLGVTIALAQTAVLRAQEQEPETILPACGIRYPGGYDPNTVGVVEGRVSSFNRPERGPVSFHIETGAETYIVHAAPAWYWDERRLNVKNGDLVRVKGSKTMGADRNLYLVAQQITVSDTEDPVLLRDTDGKPVWKGCGPQGCGRRGTSPLR